MLVSSIARFNAVNQMNNSAFGMMQASNNLLNAANNKNNAFGGEHDLAMLNKMDKKLSMDLLTNQLTYKLAYLQEKMSKKHENNEKHSCSALA